MTKKLRTRRVRRRLHVEQLEDRRLLATVSGRVFVDSNGNGVFDAAFDTGVAGRTVQLTSVGQQTATTDANGQYAFTSLPAGTYTSELLASGGQVQTFPVNVASGNFLINVPTHTGHVYDPHRNLLYLATSEGNVERFDVATQQLLAPLDVGVSLRGIDITPDGKFLYVGERQRGVTQGIIRKVNLNTGDVTNVLYARDGLEDGVFDIAMTTRGTALITTGFQGSGWVPLRELDLSDDTLVERTDAEGSGPFNWVRQNTRIHHNAARDRFVLTEANISSGPAFTFNATTNTFPAQRDLGGFRNGDNVAVNRDASLVALESFGTGLLILDGDLNTVNSSLPHHRGGVTFDPVRNILYAVDVNTDEVFAYETATFTELFRFPVGENLSASGLDANDQMTTTPDGRFLFLQTPSGVRKYTIGETDTYTRTLAVNDTVTDIDFGSVTVDFFPVAASDSLAVAPDSTDNPLDVLANDTAAFGQSVTITAVGTPTQNGTVVRNGTNTQLIYSPAAGFTGLESFTYTITDGLGRTCLTTVTVSVKPINTLGEIRGSVFEDADRDALQGGGEGGIEGMIVFLDANDNGTLDGGEPSVATAADGSYRFVNVATGTHKVRQVVEPGYDRTTPTLPATSSVLIGVTDPQDHVFDPTRRIHYITSGGQVLRYDVDGQQLLAPLTVGTVPGGASSVLSGIDISADGKYLLVGEDTADTTNDLGFVHKIDLDTNAITTVSYVLDGNERGSFDIAMSQPNKAFFTTEFAGSGWNPLHEINLTDNGLVDRSGDSPGSSFGQVRQSSRLNRSADRGTVLLTESNSSAGPFFTYNTTNDTFSAGEEANSSLSSANSAVSRDGSLIALESFSTGLSVFNNQFNTVEILPHFRAGLAFDPLRDVLYVGDAIDDVIVAYDTNTYVELFRIDIGENIPDPSGQNAYRELQVSADGKRLFLTTPSGVRMYTLGLPASTMVTVFTDRIVAGVDFGNWVNGDNRRPRAVDDPTYGTLQNQDLTVNAPGVLGNDSDPDGHSLTAVRITDATNGTVTLNANGSFTYSPNLNFLGDDSFTYAAQDATLQSTTATVTISVAAENRPPSDISLSSSSVAENAVGVEVGTLTATDPDTADTHTFSTTDARFEIVGDKLRLASGISFDHEATQSITVQVTATDNGSPAKSKTKDLTIAVADVNEFDPAISDQTLNVNENATSVGTVLASDGDTTQTLNFAIIAGDPNGIFVIGAGGVLGVASGKEIDHETASQHLLTVRVTDSVAPTRSNTATVTVNVADVNEFDPAISDQSFSIPENSAVDASVGTVAASDADTSQTLTFAITAGNTGNAFAIDPASGAIKVMTPGALDHETQASFALTVSATDDLAPTRNATATVTINIDDVNEFDPAISDQSFSIAENSAVDAAVGTVAASDADTSQSLVFAITAGNTGNAFAIDPASGAIKVMTPGALDHETQASFALTVSATDDVAPTRSATATVTINIDDVNEFDPAISDQSFSIAENSAVDAAVGTVAASDADTSQSLVFAITAGNTGNAFAIDPASGAIKVMTSGALDHETQASFALTVSATDDVAPTRNATATVTINIDDVNEFDPAISDQSFSIAENSAVDASVGTVAASDADTSQSLTFAITAGNTGNAFAIDPASGAIKVMTPGALDHETQASFALTVSATDDVAPTRSSTATVTINIDDVNEFDPAISDQSFSIAENSAVDAAVGTVAASDADTSQSLAFAITAGNTGNAFAIDPASGAIKVMTPGALDHETQASFALTVSATDDVAPTRSSTATVTINIDDVNEFDPAISDQTFSIAENSAVDASVGTVAASDADTSQSLTFAITAGNTGNAFAIDPASGAIKVMTPGALDHETQASFVLTVSATDDLAPTRSATATVTINIDDVNEFDPAISDQSFSIAENSAVDAGVGTVAASDADTSQSLVFAITAGNTGNAFAIDPASGAIKVMTPGALDHEAQTSFALTVSVTDDVAPTRSSTATVTINVADVNEFDPAISDQTFSIPENSAVSTEVGVVAASDADTSQSLTFAITAGNTNSTFAIEPATGRITVADNALLDRESLAAFDLTVSVTDDLAPTRASSATVTITIADVNEFDPQISDQTFDVDENATSIGTVSASDQDTAQTLNFAIVGGNAAGIFAIDGATGALSVAGGKVLDFESATEHQLTVRVTDSQAPTRSSDGAMTIRVHDVNEFDPAISDHVFNIPENSADGAGVGTVVASDADTAQTLTFAITAGNTNNAFAIDASSGQITVPDGSKLDHESQNSYLLTVSATDDLAPTRSSSATVTIDVSDVNEFNPSIGDQTLSIAENSAVDASVGTVAASDADTSQSLTFTITAGNTGNAFAIDPDSGEITVQTPGALDHESQASFSLTVAVTDNLAPTRSSFATVTVNVTDVNEFDPAIDDQAFAIPENSAVDTSLGTVAASDADASQMLTFAITAGNTGNAFAIDPASGEITVQSPGALDHESQAGFSLTVSVTDSVAPTRSSSATVTINVTDVNEFDPAISDQAFAIPENSAVDAGVGTVAASDADTSQSLTFAITAGNTGNAFAIDLASGEITVQTPGALDHESQASFSLTVAVTDNLAPTRSSSATITVDVTDVNEFDPAIGDQAFAIPENSAVDASLGTVAASDADTSQSLVFAITAGNAGNAFAIDPASGEITVQTPGALDHESQASFSLTVAVTDNLAPTRSSSATVTVDVTDVNEFDPAIGDQGFAIPENSAVDAGVGTVVASDADTSQSLTFAITAGNTGNAFAIDPASGEITVQTPGALDHESQASLSLTVAVTDNLAPTRSSSATVTVNVTDVNEFDPAIGDQAFAIPENSAVDTSVGTVAASDADSSQSLTFTITAGNTGNAFAIDPASGEITVQTLGALDHESQASFSLIVAVTDNLAPTRSSSATVTVNVTDVNEFDPAIGDQAFAIPENSAVDTSLATIVASDADTSQSLTFAITAGNTGNAFAIDPASGEITVQTPGALDHETQASFSLTIAVTDSLAPTRSSSAMIAVDVTDVNEFNPAISDQTLSIPENSAVDAGVGTVAASDADTSQSLVFAITAGNTGNAFAIDPASGAITVQTPGALDHESQASFLLTVAVTDDLAPTRSSSATITVNVTDVNEFDPAISDQAFSVAENSAVDAGVGTVAASDADTSQSLTFAITAGNTGNAFAIDPASGEITVQTPGALDHESQAGFSLTVAVTDSLAPTRSSSATVTVTVTDVNEFDPAISDQTFAIPENSAVDTNVGSVAASDADTSQSLTFSITAGNTGNAFSIDPASGLITVQTPGVLDHESQASFPLTVAVTDDLAPTRNSSATVTVNVTDVNEFDPAIGDQTFSIAENSAADTSLGTVAASDADTSQSLVFTITAGNTGNAFAIDPASGEITVQTPGALDHESQAGFLLTVAVTDSLAPTRSSSATITVNVSDVNEFAPAIGDQAFSIAENTAAGTSTGTVVAGDADTSQSLTFAITAGNAGDAFAIDPVSGEITVKTPGALDHESQASFSLSVAVTDDLAPARTSTATVTIAVTDLNEFDPAISDQTLAIPENSANDTIVGTVVADDDDTSQSLGFAITAGNTGNAFAIDPASGEISVRNRGKLDHEAQAVFSLTVAVTDDLAPTRTSSATVTVDVTDVNEFDPVIDDQTFSVAENSPTDTSVGTVVASDGDTSQPLTFFILNGNIGDAFAIDRTSGEITVRSPGAIDHEARSSFSLAVLVTDDRTPKTATVTINTTDVNEFDPAISDRAFSIAENSPADTSLGTVAAGDADTSQSLTFAITAGNTDDTFAIDSVSGEISVLDGGKLDHESQSSYALTVAATDDLAPTRTSTATVTVDVIDVNEFDPAIDDQAFAIPENSAVDTSLGTVAASDADTSHTLAFAITAGNVNDAFAIDAASGLIRVQTSAELNHEVTPSFSLTVEITDSGQPPRRSSATVTIDINDVDEPPSTIELDNQRVTENILGQVVGVVSATDQDQGETLTLTVSDDRFEIVGDRLKLKNDRSVRLVDGANIPLTITATDSATPPQSLDVAFDLTVLANLMPWTNPVANTDANGDGATTSRDAGVIINQLNNPTVIDATGRLPAREAGSTLPFYDVNGDGFGTSADVRIVINLLNQVEPEGELFDGEGEQSSRAMPVAASGWQARDVVFAELENSGSPPVRQVDRDTRLATPGHAEPGFPAVRPAMSASDRSNTGGPAATRIRAELLDADLEAAIAELLRSRDDV